MSETIENPQQNSKKSKTTRAFFYTVLSITLVCGLLFSVMLNLILGASLLAFGGEQGNTKSKLQKKVIEGKGENKVLVIPIDGIIMGSNAWNDKITSPKKIRKVLKQAAKDKPKAIILKINSPGGTITATDEIYQMLIDFKQKHNIPVVAHFDEVAASGGYYLAMASDRITASATCITGSIGVIMSSYQIQDLLGKIGVRPLVFKSGKHKDIGSMSRTLDEQERKIFQDIIDEMYARFVEKVKTGRPDLDQSKLPTLADGRIFTGQQALNHGLIDATGYFTDSVDQLAKTLNLARDQIQLYKYGSKRSFWQEMLEAKSADHKMIKNFVNDVTTPRFYYLWKP